MRLDFSKKSLRRAFENSQILKTPAGSYFNPKPTSKEGDLAFVYPGSATAYEGIGNDLFQLFPELLPHYENLAESIDEFLWSDYLYPKSQSKNQTHKPIQKRCHRHDVGGGILFDSVHAHFAFLFQHSAKSSLWLQHGRMQQYVVFTGHLES